MILLKKKKPTKSDVIKEQAKRFKYQIDIYMYKALNLLRCGSTSSSRGWNGNKKGRVNLGHRTCIIINGVLPLSQHLEKKSGKSLLGMDHR